MALEASSWARGGQRGAVDGVAAGWAAGGFVDIAPVLADRPISPACTAGRTCGWIFSGGSLRKAAIGSAMYAVLGGVGYVVADAVGENIVVMRKRQRETQGSAAAPPRRDLLDGLPEWFPVRKLSTEEATQRRRDAEAEAEAEARASRERWTKQHTEHA